MLGARHRCTNSMFSVGQEMVIDSGGLLSGKLPRGSVRRAYTSWLDLQAVHASFGAGAPAHLAVY